MLGEISSSAFVMLPTGAARPFMLAKPDLHSISNSVLSYERQQEGAMIFFGVSTLQDVHVLLSLVGIAAGLVVLFGLLTSRLMGGMTAVFLVTTLLTNLTGFVFPFGGFTPAIGVGIIGTLVMVICLVARYLKNMQGGWRGIYVITAVLSLYLNVFVLVVQLFLKVPSLNALAPNGNEPPFAIVQGLVLLVFLIAGWLAFKAFNPAGRVILSPVR